MTIRPFLQSADAWNLVRASTTLSLPKTIAIAIRPSRPSDLALAHLLAKQSILPNKPSLHIIATENDVNTLNQFSDHNKTSTIHKLSSSSYPRHPNDLQPYAKVAVENDIPLLILPETRVDTISHALTSIDATVPNSFVGGLSTGIEMVPSTTLTCTKPLTNIDEAVLDATISNLQIPFASNIPTEIQRANLELDPISIEDGIRHISNKASSIKSLRDESTQLILSSVLEASHWGYVVIRRSTLASYYHSGRAGRLVAIHALSRIILHVSGADHHLPLGDEQISKLAKQLLSIDNNGHLVSLSKGRTAAGTVVRPATGRFAKRVLQIDRGNRRRPRTNSRDLFGSVPDDLMILTREPDHESAGLFGLRLRGNYSCSPLSTDPQSNGIYWDNRYVINAVPITELSQGRPLLQPKQIVLAALNRPQIVQDEQDSKADSQDKVRSLLYENELYARQIRRMDWEKITGITNRVKNFHIPFQCIRGLPAIFQKKKNSHTSGELIASPHLGLSARPDLFFTAVRMPRFRSLPPSIDPGFVEEHFPSQGYQSLDGDTGTLEQDSSTARSDRQMVQNIDTK